MSSDFGEESEILVKEKRIKLTRRGKALLFHHRGIKLQTMFHSKAPKTWGTVIIKSASKKSAVKVGRLFCQKNEEKNSKKVGTLSAILKLKKSYIAKAFGFYFLRVADRSLAFFQKYGARSKFFLRPDKQGFFSRTNYFRKKTDSGFKNTKKLDPFFALQWSMVPPPVYSCNCACNFVNFVIIWTI